jgi:antitoxin component YwqK of YwqJK toxin-antitoxin module
MLDGMLASGKMDGTWTSTGSDGTRLATWSYRQGVRHGPVKMWFGALRYPEAGGRLKLEGAFAEGSYDGTATRYYPSGTKQTIRVYDRGVLKSSQYWSPGGSEATPATAAREADSEHKQDMAYLSTLEDMVTRSLAQARREVRK